MKRGVSICRRIQREQPLAPASQSTQTQDVSEFQFGGEFVWHPSPELIAQSNLQQFTDRHQLGSYGELMRRSTRDVAWFWDTVLRDLDIQFYKPYSRVVDLSDGKPWAKWCVCGEMNIVHNLLDKYADTPIDKKLAIKSEIEDPAAAGRSLTYKELRDQVDRMANALRALGLGKGDAVGVFMPMVPEIVVAMLAIIKIGGIFLPLFSGFGAATMMFYDGAPDVPGPDRVWSLVARHKVTALGVSPTLIRALRRYGDEIVHRHDLSSLRKFASTGEPWNPEPWMWLFQNVGRGKLPIINYSGGTEISGGILMGNVLTPMKPCAFSGPLPGMAADVVDENGKSARGQVGELVIREPWIGMTRGFWKDRQRYIDAYWARFPNVWVHGDWAAVDDDGLWYILGRSDDTIKIAGKRVGPAEVESVLVAHLQVSEAAAIGVPDSIKGEALACFCVLKKGVNGDVALAAELKENVARDLGKALAPREVVFVGDIPKTRNAKVMRRVVRAAYLGEKLGDTSALENPASLDEIKRAAASSK